MDKETKEIAKWKEIYSICWSDHNHTEVLEVWDNPKDAFYRYNKYCEVIKRRSFLSRLLSSMISRPEVVYVRQYETNRKRTGQLDNGTTINVKV